MYTVYMSINTTKISHKQAKLDGKLKYRLFNVHRVYSAVYVHVCLWLSAYVYVYSYIIISICYIK